MLDLTLKTVGAALGAIGAVLGVYNYVHARRKEAREEAEKDAAREQEQLEWKLYAGLLKASREGYVLIPEDGSEEHRIAENLVAKGMLERLPPGMGYAIPGQQLLFSTEPKSSAKYIMTRV